MLKRNSISFEVIRKRSEKLLSKAVVEAPSMWRRYYLPVPKNVSGDGANLYDPELVQRDVNFLIHPDVVIGGFYLEEDRRDVRLSQSSVGGGASNHESQGPQPPIVDVQTSRGVEAALNRGGRPTPPEESVDDDIVSLPSESADNDICDSHDSDTTVSEDRFGGATSKHMDVNDTLSQIERVEVDKYPTVDSYVCTPLSKKAAAAIANAAARQDSALRSLCAEIQRKEQQRARSSGREDFHNEMQSQVELDVDHGDLVDGTQTQAGPSQVHFVEGESSQKPWEEDEPDIVVVARKMAPAQSGSGSRGEPPLTSHAASAKVQHRVAGVGAGTQTAPGVREPPEHDNLFLSGRAQVTAPTEGGEARATQDVYHHGREEESMDLGEIGSVGKKDAQLQAEVGDNRKAADKNAPALQVETLVATDCAVSSTPECLDTTHVSDCDDARRAERAWKTAREAELKRKAAQKEAEKEALAKEEEEFVQKFSRPAPPRIILRSDTDSEEDDDLTRGRLLWRYNCIWPKAGVRPVDRVGNTHVNMPTPEPRKPERVPEPEPSSHVPTSSGPGSAGASFSFHTPLEEEARVVMKTELIEEQWMRKRKAELDRELDERVNKKLKAVQEEMKAQNEAMVAKLYADIAAGRVQLPIPDPSTRPGNLSEIQSGVSNAGSPLRLPLPTPTPATPIVPVPDTLVSPISRVDPDLVPCTPDPLLLSQFDATHGM